MLDSTVDFVTQAASNSLFIFCVCNFIIVMIFMGSKPGSYFEQESEIPVSIVTSSYNRNTDDDKQVDDAKCEKEAAVFNSPIFYRKASNANNELAMATTDDNGSIAYHNDCEVCDKDDELRRRVEEFIQKVNRERRAELLRTYTSNLGKKSLNL